MIFQFPKNQIPRIDGDFSDWDIVPDTYIVGLADLQNTRLGEGEPQNAEDFDLKVKVGWVKDLDRLYFHVTAYDDFWDFEDRALGQDLFELVVDGDVSGGKFINQDNWNFGKRASEQPFFEGAGTGAQNYHIFTPALDKDWAMPWGNSTWIKEFPYSNVAYKYDFKQGESGEMQMEFYVTPFDFAAFEGPAKSIVSNLEEDAIVGISWAILDFDGASCETFMNLSDDFNMIADASYLRQFRLMPIEEELSKPIKADWKFAKYENSSHVIHFIDQSTGEISKWLWNFGDGTTSDLQNPTHEYSENNVWTVKLKVEGASGISELTKVWEIITELK